MRSTVFIAILAFALVSFKTPKDITLNLTVSNIDKVEGKLYVAIIAQKDAKGFPEDRDAFYKYVINEVTSSTQQVKFDLPEGTYALSVLQDLNGNAKMDKNFFGIPEEPYGFSNNFTPTFSAPDFDDCAFKLSESLNKLEIKLIQ